MTLRHYPRDDRMHNLFKEPRHIGSCPLRKESLFSQTSPSNCSLLTRYDWEARREGLLLESVVREERIRIICERLNRSSGQQRRRAPRTQPMVVHQKPNFFQWDKLTEYLATMVAPIYDKLGNCRKPTEFPTPLGMKKFSDHRSAITARPMQNMKYPHQQPQTIGAYHHVTGLRNPNLSTLQGRLRSHQKYSTENIGAPPLKCYKKRIT